MHGLKIGEIDGEVCLRLDKHRGTTYAAMLTMHDSWQQTAVKLKAGEITKDEYDQWRYRYPEFDTSQRWGKVPSQELSDMLVKKLKK